jgi:hypothetical protein
MKRGPLIFFETKRGPLINVELACIEQRERANELMIDYFIWVVSVLRAPAGLANYLRVLEVVPN